MKIDTHLRTKEKPLVYTSLLLLLPLILSVILGLNIGIIIAIVTVFSTLHHLLKKPGSEWWWNTKGRSPLQSFLLVIEIISSLVLTVWSFLLLLEKSSASLWISVLIFIPTFILYLSTDYKKYVLYHSIWHCAIATIVSLALV